MKLSRKWTLLFLLTSSYVFVFAGLWYSNLFRWFFDEQLKQEAIAWVHISQNRFVSGLISSPKAVTIEEVDTMKNFLNDPRVVDAVVVDKYGRVRWSQDTGLFGKSIQDLETTQPLPTKAILRAYVTKVPKVLPFKRDKKDFYEVSVPLV